MSAPDAVLITIDRRQARCRGERLYDRVNAISTWAEQLLGLDRRAGQNAKIRLLPETLGFGTNVAFITGLFTDTLFMGAGSRKERYRWEIQPNGDRYGYLIDEAKS